MSARRAMEMTRFFYYGEHLVRAMVVNGKVWFRANDVVIALGYCSPGVRPGDVVRARIPSRWRLPLGALLGRSECLLFDRLGHNKSLETWITELGVYTLALGSRLPDADAFAEWVHGEVVPACLA
jgi:prophage antirepressor-like protein